MAKWTGYTQAEHVALDKIMAKATQHGPTAWDGTAAGLCEAGFTQAEIAQLMRSQAFGGTEPVPTPAENEAVRRQLLAFVDRAERQLHGEISTNGNCGERGWYPR